jgi:hypothetical protein
LGNTSPGSLNTARYALAGAGTLQSALGFGGLDPSPALQQQQKNGQVQELH